MAEHLTITKGTKEEQYNFLLPQLKAMIEGESDLIANMANISAALKAQFDWLWVGFYIVKKDELVLGPFQGPIACTRIQKGKGVCGTSFEKKQTIIVQDVNQFPGHIFCSNLSLSEIVVPIMKDDFILAVLDIDSAKYSSFDETDRVYLEKIAAIVAEIW
ncbi:MAG: GAF domain-containing protein [Ferruginibacter sp.]|nr:GAF domain-containing protein [Ferruginibacter sp.]